ncbi:MAG: hypothetical protein CME05_00275 [Gemmatimonadaceae bacterium]|nr:hypothetical protein [Gemmatimonadaceae bacterium]
MPATFGRQRMPGLGAGATLATAAYATDDTPRDQLSSVDGVARVTDVYGAGTFSIPDAIGLWVWGIRRSTGACETSATD